MAKRHGVTARWGRTLAGLMASNPHLDTQTALAKQSGVAQSTIGRILRGAVDPQSENVERLARAFGLTYSALAALAEGDGSDTGSAPRRLAAERRTGVPLLSWVVPAQGLEPSEGLPHPAHVIDWIDCPRKPRGPRTVAYRVSGESMEPDYPHGTVIYVDPDVAAVHGKDVVVCLSESDEVVFHRLVVERRRGYLKSLNPNWPTQIIPLPNRARILGVVVGKYADQ